MILYALFNTIGISISYTSPGMADLFIRIGILSEGCSYLSFYIYSSYIRRYRLDMKDVLILAFFLFSISETSLNSKIIFLRTSEGLKRLPVIIFNNVMISSIIYTILFLILSTSFTYNAYLIFKKYGRNMSKLILNLGIGILFFFVSLSYSVCIFVQQAFFNIFDTLSIVVISILSIILMMLIFAPDVIIVPLHDFFFIGVYDDTYSEIASFINREYDVNFILEIIDKINSIIELLTTEGVIEMFGLNIMKIRGEVFTVIIATDTFMDYYVKFARRIINKLEKDLKFTEEKVEDLSLYAAKVLVSELKSVLVI